MRDCFLKKEAHVLKQKKLGLWVEPEVPEAQENQPDIDQQDPEELRIVREEEQKEERDEFGRPFIWERYYTEPEKQEHDIPEIWEKASHIFRHVNVHVIQDMQDLIILKVFDLKTDQDVKKMVDIIDDMKKSQDTEKKEEERKKLKKRKKKDPKEEEDELEKEREEIRKRSFCTLMRPPYIWNFFGAEDEEIEHLINPTVDPAKCYKFEEDNRVTKVFKMCSDIGKKLKETIATDVVDWDKLINHTVEIFKETYELKHKK